MKKQINSVIEFNIVRGLHKQGFDPIRENSFTLSEELEVLHWGNLAEDIGIRDHNSDNHDKFATFLQENYGVELHDTVDARVDFIDKGVDHWTFFIGGMLKMGMNADQMLQCFQHVIEANALKPIGKVNKDGKQQKGEGFEKIDPKHKIREIVESLA